MSKKVEATIPGIEKSRLWTIADCLSDAFLAVCDEGRLVGSIIMEVRYQNGDRILRIDGHGECELAVPEQEGASEALGEPKASEHTSPNAREAALLEEQARLRGDRPMPPQGGEREKAMREAFDLLMDNKIDAAEARSEAAEVLARSLASLTTPV
jgi:hypothetical protein